MTPRTLFYLIGAIIIVICLYRIWKKRQAPASLDDFANEPDAVTPKTSVPPPLDVEPVLSERVSGPERTPEPDPEPEVFTPREPIREPEVLPPPAPVRDYEPRPVESYSSSTATLAPARREYDPERPLEASEMPFTDGSDYLFGPITPALASLLPESDERRDEVKSELRAAGEYEPHAYENISALRMASILVPMVICLVALLIVPPVLENLVLICLIVLPLLGWSIPRLVLRGKARDRKMEIERAMPDMLDMMNMCVSQGLTVQQSLTRIASELGDVYPALSQELRIVAEQARLYNLRDALENFSRRIDVPEVHSFTTLMIQTERMGTSVSQALTEYSDNMRESLRQRADEKANRATFRMLFPTVACLLPAVLLFLLSPAILDLSDFFNNGGNQVLDNTNRVRQTLDEPIVQPRDR